MEHSEPDRQREHDVQYIEGLSMRDETPSPLDFGSRNLEHHADSVGRVDPWAPVVIDQPIIDFEPRPPSMLPYSADTICDGWSTDKFIVRLASVRGYSHRYSGAPRQDDAIVAYEAESGAVVFAVADGVSSAVYSHVGANIACRKAVDTILREIGRKNLHSMNWSQVIEMTAEAIRDKAAEILGQQNLSLDEAENCLGTTLVTGFLLPTHEGISAQVVQVGDTGAWILNRGQYRPVIKVKNTLGVISNTVFPLPRVPHDISYSSVDINGDSIFLIGTDGFGDPLGEGDGLVGQLFSERLKVAPPPRYFAHLLDFSRETFDDDRTLVAVWRRGSDERAQLQ